MLKHTQAATPRWDWLSNSCAEDLPPLLPPFLFLFFIDLSDTLVFIFIFLYILGGFHLTSRTHWHSHMQDGSLTHLAWFKGRAWKDHRFIKPTFPVLIPQFQPFQRKRVLCVCVCFCFFCTSVYPIICVSVISEYLYFCSLVCENECTYGYTFVLADKKNPLMTTAAFAVSITNPDSFFPLF